MLSGVFPPSEAGPRGCYEEKDENKKFIRRERFSGKIVRRFYVGEVNKEDIKASFTDGILKITLPKETKKETKSEDKDYSKMTLAELKSVAKDRGIKGYSTMKKDELLAALN